MEYEWGGQEKEGELMEVKIKRSEDSKDSIHLKDLEVSCCVGKEFFKGRMTSVEWNGLISGGTLEIRILGKPTKKFLKKIFKIGR